MLVGQERQVRHTHDLWLTGSVPGIGHGSGGSGHSGSFGGRRFTAGTGRFVRRAVGIRPVSSYLSVKLGLLLSGFFLLLVVNDFTNSVTGGSTNHATYHTTYYSISFIDDGTCRSPGTSSNHSAFGLWAPFLFLLGLGTYAKQHRYQEHYAEYYT